MNEFSRRLLALAVAAGTAGTAPASDGENAVTIYSSLQPGAVSPDLYRPVAGRSQGAHVPGYAIVRHDRPYELSRGQHPLRITDVAALIDPTTVSFASLDEPRTRVIEQSFQFDLVSQTKLMQKFIGQRITVEQPLGDTLNLIEGVLLGATDGLILQLDNGSVQALRHYGNVRFPDLPGGLITRPTLEWQLDSPVSSTQNTRISYETKGMTWWADYNVVLDESDGCQLDLGAWVSIINQSGASYDNAKLKLIAGDVNRAEMPRGRRELMARTAMLAEDSARSFEEKAFFEYHLYTLPWRTDLPQNATKQIELFPTARGVSCEKELVFAPTLDWRYHGGQQLDQGYGSFSEGDVNVYLRFANEEKNGLGMPLPAGRIRVNQLDLADGSLEFIGEDVIDHTPKNEEVRIELGNAFDVVGERKQSDFRVDTRSRQLWETFEIRLRNHKDETVNVAVVENLYRMANWEIEGESHGFDKLNSNRIRFDVEVPPGKETVVRYTAHYTW